MVSDLVVRHPAWYDRWLDAQNATDSVLEPESFWIRETPDLVNVAWLTEESAARAFDPAGLVMCPTISYEQQHRTANA